MFRGLTFFRASTLPPPGSGHRLAGSVHGIDGLTIADASIMPTIPTGTTNLPTIMVAETHLPLADGLTSVSSPVASRRVTRITQDRVPAPLQVLRSRAMRPRQRRRTIPTIACLLFVYLSRPGTPRVAHRASGSSVCGSVPRWGRGVGQTYPPQVGVTGSQTSPEPTDRWSWMCQQPGASNKNPVPHSSPGRS